MNSFHELGSRTMSKNLTQEKYRVKPSQKQAECTAQSQPARPAPACRAPCAHPAPAPLLPHTPRACRCLLRTPARPLRPTPSRPVSCSARPCSRTRSPARSARALRTQLCVQRLPSLRPAPCRPVPCTPCQTSRPCHDTIFVS